MTSLCMMCVSLPRAEHAECGRRQLLLGNQVLEDFLREVVRDSLQAEHAPSRVDDLRADDSRRKRDQTVDWNIDYFHFRL